MSNKAERDKIGELLQREWKDYAAILDDRGETWKTTDPMRWPASSALHSLDHAIRRLLDVAKIVGLDVTRASLERDHRAIEEYRRMFPGAGMPTLEDVVKSLPPAA
ncbi:hypothetical protein [Streptomyces sp. NPDC088915]|uniref:hypothetical protein n=1 Tax=Streptomyces sp. NPDC088915 TaxID=3365912 RepID=UPI0037FCBBC0